jgi:hypothetical protein
MEQNQQQINTPDSTQLDSRLSGLVEKYGARVVPDRFKTVGAYEILFPLDEGNVFVTIRILLNDKTGSDIVVTNMTTLPPDRKAEGFGSEGLKKVLEWSRENNFKEIRATQVEDKDAEFWTKNGFVKDEKYSQTKDYILKLN